MNTKDVLSDLKKSSSKKRAETSKRFFKTGKDEYGEGDIFWGITVPDVRKVAKKYKELPIDEVLILLKNKIHEVRQCAVCILVLRYKDNPSQIYKIYLTNTKYINSWDLVDMSAGLIVGQYLNDKPKKILITLAKSENLWERRIAIVATYNFIYNKKYKDTFNIAEILINDKHDLIQKAVGWMLREVGKRSQGLEEEFLEKYAKTMPRTTLRYAIERFPKEKRLYYLNLKNT